MTAQNSTRSYIVESTPETMDNIATNLLPISDKDAFFAIHNAHPLDLDALRLVLEAASFNAQGLFEASMIKRNEVSKEQAERSFKIRDAIAKLEALTK